MGDNQPGSIATLALFLALAACYRLARQASGHGVVVRDERGSKYNLQVATTPENEKVVVATAI